jgi:hypothetical protein
VGYIVKQKKVEIRGCVGRWLQTVLENSKHTESGKVWLTDHSPSFTAKVKNAWSYTSTFPYAFITLCLIKDRYKFTCLPFNRILNGATVTPTLITAMLIKFYMKCI